MSSLAAAKADNFYFPPEWTPAMGGLNKFRHSNGALGARANRLKSEGILVIRFELPFHSWCEGCKIHIARGVRYNADKKKVDMYHTTPVYEFRMKCHLCDQYFVIRTDPEHRDYAYISGIRKKVMEYSAESAEAIELPDAEEKFKLANDAFKRLEKADDDKRAAASKEAAVTGVIDIQARGAEHVEMNRQLRRAMRVRRREAAADEAAGRAHGYKFALLPASAVDGAEAAGAEFRRPLVAPRAARAIQRARIENGPVFGGGGGRSSAGSGGGGGGGGGSSGGGGAEGAARGAKRRRTEPVLDASSLARVRAVVGTTFLAPAGPERPPVGMLSGGTTVRRVAPASAAGGVAAQSLAAAAAAAAPPRAPAAVVASAAAPARGLVGYDSD